MKSLLLVNQVAGPLTLDLLHELVARGSACRLLTGELQYDAPLPPGVELLPACRLDKSRVLRRFLTWGAFTLQAAHAIWCSPRDPVLVVSNPPWAILIMPLLGRLRAVRYVVLVYDVYPDVAERLGMLRRDGVVARVWRWLSARALARAEGVVTLGEVMAATLARHARRGTPPAVRVIPPWVDTDVVRPVTTGQNRFVDAHGLHGRFVVMHSGAFSATHDVHSILAAARRLTDLPGVVFVLIGGGTREREVAAAVAEQRLPNLLQLPYQSMELFPEALAAADCMLVSVDPRTAGVMLPSRAIYGLAAGAALLVLGPRDGELAQLADAQGCGYVIPPGDAGALAERIRQLQADPERLDAMKRRAREAATAGYSRHTHVAALATYLDQHLGGTVSDVRPRPGPTGPSADRQ